jgi:protein TonB
MKKHLLIFLVFFMVSIFSNAQISVTDTSFFPPPPPYEKGKTIKDDNDNEFHLVEVEAEFPGGLREWSKFLQKNLNADVPVNNKARKGKYTVVIRFIVDTKGNISDIKAETNNGYGMEKEVMRVIALGPNWTPAMQGGSFVKAYRRQPVTFMVE